MKTYHNYSESDLRLFKAAAKINDLNGLRRQIDRKQLIINDGGYSRKSTNTSNQPLYNIRKSTSLPKINFTYNRPLSLKSSSLNNKFTQTLDKKIQQKHLYLQNKKHQYMNVISKNYIPRDVLTFVYGKSSIKQINSPNILETHPSSFNVKIRQQQQSHYRASKINKGNIIYDRMAVDRVNGLMYQKQSFESFPVSKIRRSRNNSRKSSCSELQLSGNGKNQMQQQQIKHLRQTQNNQYSQQQKQQRQRQIQRVNVWLGRRQQTRERQKLRQDDSQNKLDKNNNNQKNIDNFDFKQQQHQNHQLHQHYHVEQNEELNSFLQRQDWNNTIKFNHINLNLNNSNNQNNQNNQNNSNNSNSNIYKPNKLNKQLQQTNHSSNFNHTQSTAINTTKSPFIQQDNTNNIKKQQTQKISQFILCDQQIGIEENPFKEKHFHNEFYPIIRDGDGDGDGEGEGDRDNVNGNGNDKVKGTLRNNNVNENNNNNNKNKVYQNNYLFQQYTVPDGQNKQRNIPVFEIKLSDLQLAKDLQLQNIKKVQSNNQPPIKEQQEKILHNIETSDTLGGQRQQQTINQNQCQNNNINDQKNFHIYDRLQSSIQQLGRNIGDLSGKISVINGIKNDQSNLLIGKIKNTQQKRLGLASNCYSQQVGVNNNYNDKSYQKQQQGNELKALNDDDSLQQKSIDEIRIINEYVGDNSEEVNENIDNTAMQKHYNEQINHHQHHHQPHLDDNQSQNEFLNLSYSRQLKQHQHNLFNQTLLQHQNQPSQIKPINQNHTLGSLEIIDHETSLMGQSLQNLYDNHYHQQKLLSDGQKQIRNQQHRLIQSDNNNTFLHYQQQTSNQISQQNDKHAHFEQYDENQQNKFNQQFQNIPQQRQQKSLTQNFLNKLQRQRRIRQFYGVKTFQKTRSKSEIQKNIKNKPYNVKGQNKNLYNKTYYNNKNFERQSNKIFESKGLNYQMYKTYRDKSLSKRYTLLGMDHRKQRLIELPYMDRPFELKLNGGQINLPKYIKSKVYYVKG